MDAPRLIASRRPAVVLTVALGLTLGASLVVGFIGASRDRAHFIAAAVETRERIQARFDTYELLLRGAEGLFAVRMPETGAELERYVEPLRLQAEHPGLLAIGWLPRVDAAARPSGVEPWPEPQAGRDVFPVVFHAPSKSRSRILGFDMASDPVRLVAMEAARDAAAHHRSGRVALMFEPDPTRQHGFMIYAPIYEGEPATLEERRAQLRGFVYGAFRVEDLFRGVLLGASGDVELAVYDGGAAHGTPLFASADRPANMLFRDVEVVSAAGRPFAVELWSSPAFDTGLGFTIALAMATLGTLLSVVSWRLASAEARARARADEGRREVERERAALHVLTLQHRSERDRLDAILGGVSDGVTAQDGSGRLAFVNDAAARMCGFGSAEEMLRTPAKEIVGRFQMLDEDGLPIELDLLPGRRALRGEEPGELIVRFRQKGTGAERWSIVTATAVKDPNGEPLAINVFRDITERRSVAEGWRFLAEATAVLSSSLDWETTLERVARMAVPRLGDWCVIDTRDGEGMRLLAVAHADPKKVELAREYRKRFPTDPHAAGGSADVFRTGKPIVYASITDDMLRSSSVSAQHLEMARELELRSAVLAPLRAGDQILGVLTIISSIPGRYGEADLTLAIELGRRAGLAMENARLYREAQGAIRRRDDFLSVASHELKTPLSSALLQVQSLARTAARGDTVAQPKLVDRLQRAASQLGKLAALINQLLDVSRVSTNRLSVERQPTDLTALVGEVIARFEDAAAAAGCRLDLRIEPGVTGMWDPDRLDQVLTNLIGNALKYGAGKPIEVVLRREAGDVVLAVRDLGVGIDPADHGRIFERFERAAPIRHYGGLGLGLWIARSIVEAHGGEIAVESALGQGALFTVRLPLALAAESVAETQH